MNDDLSQKNETAHTAFFDTFFARVVFLSPLQAQETDKPQGVNQAVNIAPANNLNLRVQKEEVVEHSQGESLAELDQVQGLVSQ